MKFLLVPLAILALVVFLLVLGAIGLFISMAAIAALGRIWRFLGGAGRVRPRSGRGATSGRGRGAAPR